MTIYQDLVGNEDGTVCGADFSRILDLVDQDDSPLLVASFVGFYFTLRRKWAPPGATDADVDVIAQVALGAGIAAEGDSAVLVTIPGAQLVVPARVYVYDLKGVTILSQRVVLARGNFEILPRATATAG